MYAIAPMSSLGAPLAPIRSVSKHKRPQSQPRPASRAVAIDDQQMLALGYHETQQGAPPVPLIPARSPLRSRANSASATLGVEMMVVTAPPPVPPMPATLKKKHIRTLKTTAARPVQAAPSGSSMPLTAPPRPPRPDDIDCLLDSSPPADYPPPMPPIPVDLLANVPRARQTRGHGHSNSFGSSSNTSGSGSASISTPRVSQDSLEFRHVPLSSHSSTSTHARSNSQKSISSNPHPGEMPSMSVFEESSDEDELAYALDRGSSRKFRKGGLSLITRSSNKQPSSKDTTFNAPPRITPGKKTPTASGHHAPNPKLGPSHGSETLSSTSTGERTLPDDPSNKRFGRALSGRNGPPKMDHPDDELIALMQGLKKPKRRENSTRTRPSHERDVTESQMKLEVAARAGVSGAGVVVSEDATNAASASARAARGTPLIATPIPGHRLDLDLAFAQPNHCRHQYQHHRQHNHERKPSQPALLQPLRPRRNNAPANMAGRLPGRQAPRSFPLVAATQLARRDVALEPVSLATTPPGSAPVESELLRSSSSRRRLGNHARGASDETSTKAEPFNVAQQVEAVPAAVPRPNPPAIRLISAEAEKESQKVRSLYTSGEDLNWEDEGEPPPHRSDTATQLAADSPSDAEHEPNDAPDTELPSTRGSQAANSVALTDGEDPDLPTPWVDESTDTIEDWDGVNVEDVDRYGFIQQAKPPQTAVADYIDTMPDSPRKPRSILLRKSYASNSLSVKTGPSRKSSNRSLYSHASDFSTATHRSSRSPIRSAMNLLPHNRDRRLVDEAGEVLAMQPGLTNIAEDESAEVLADEAKRKEVSRTGKWRRMATVVKQGEDGQGMVFEFDLKHPKLLKRVWKGIPDCWRSAAWFSFLASSARASGDSYATDEQLKSDFLRLLDVPSPDDGQIDLDVPRTINQHIMFRRRYRGGQRLLFRVLHCVSLYFPDIGYVQGMAPLAATLLSYYDEERCFIMLVRLWKYRGLDWLYTADFPKLMETLQDFETLWLADREVAKTLADLSVLPMAYATRWYLTLFNLAIPFAAQLRIWDAFMLLGATPQDALPSASPGKPASQGLEVLHAASAAIIDVYNDCLLDSDFENAMKILTSWVPIKDVEHFIGVVHAEWKRHTNQNKAF